MLEAKAISKVYKGYNRKSFFKLERYEKLAIQDINIKINKGKIVGVLGQNGAGKTTIIKILTSMLEPTTGSVYMDGVDINKNLKLVKQRINLISGGERSLYWRLTGKENVEYFGRLYGVPEKVLRTRVDEVLQLVDLADVKNTAVERYSKGMKQRLQIAKGLINDPDYIFLDEPTLGLDIVMKREFMKYVKKLADAGKGIVLTTHYIQEAEEICDYIYIVNGGRIVKEGTVDSIKRQYDIKPRWKIMIPDLDELIINVLKNDFRGKDLEINYENKFLHIQADEDKISEYLTSMECKGIRVVGFSKVDPLLEDILYEIIKE